MGDFRIQIPTDSGEISFQKVFGAWAVVAPTDVADMIRGFERPWWVVGGWALDAFTGLRRDHGDVDISMFRRDVKALRPALEGRVLI